MRWDSSIAPVDFPGGDDVPFAFCLIIGGEYSIEVQEDVNFGYLKTRKPLRDSSDFATDVMVYPGCGRRYRRYRRWARNEAAETRCSTLILSGALLQQEVIFLINFALVVQQVQTTAPL